MTHAPTTPDAVKAPAGPSESFASRAERLEALLGDPLDPANPLGRRAVLAADERGELLPEGERALRAYGLGAEFVPTALGGRFDRADELARLMRSVFRRDCALGVGHGITSFIAALPVWADGTGEQRRRAADVLLSGGRIAAAYTELDHGSDFARISLTARPDSGGYVLHGGKQLVNNIGRAEAAVFFVRTDDRPGSRGHSHLLVGLGDLPPGGADRSARYPTSGVRGCLLGGIEFDGCRVPGDTLLGAEGGAMETVLKVFQVTRSVLPGMVVGVGDTQLRTVLSFARERMLYGRPVAALPHARGILTGAFLDLLVCDALATVGARSLHLLPGEASVRSAAVKYLVPKLLQDNSYRLSVLLGARGYLREGPHAVFQKAARDLPVVALAHAGGAVCRANIVPQLPRLADHAWLPALAAAGFPSGAGPGAAAPAPGFAGPAEPHRTAPCGTEPARSLFRLDDPLPPLDLGRLSLTSRGDTLAGTLPVIARELGARDDLPRLAALARLFADQLADLAHRSAALPPRDRTPVAGRRGFLLADRYAHLLAAASCLGVWYEADAAASAGFAADPLWVTGALTRIAERLGLGPPPLRDDDVRRLGEELTARHDSARTFDLFHGRLAQRPVPAQGAAS
ncbi:acyl-CoA dehydrogenase [Streptomyces sp. NPDC004609]|uniref:acyl-CoA dehydrogenase n=1 Tax=Streptomyces sp. NPDC004609 TaxID=3364704 RepID=UPI0036B614E8